MSQAKKAVESQLLPDSVTTLYTVPAGTRAYVRTKTFFNTHQTESVVVQVYRVPSGAAADNSNIKYEVYLAPRGTWEWFADNSNSPVMEEGYTLQVAATVAGRANFEMDVVELKKD